MPLAISITDESGSPYSLENNEVLRFGVVKNAGDSVYLFEKEMGASDVSDGAYTCTINPADTASLGFGKYFYDVGLQSGNDYYNVIECSEFIVCCNVTRWSDEGGE